jgi:phosphoglycerate dehydrogenase-like enzyme
MRILILSNGDDGRREQLRSSLGDDFELKWAPWSADAEALATAAWCEVIVGGRVPREMLDAASRLRAVVIPYAGIPAQDRANLQDFPDVLLLNSHYNARYAAEHAWALLLAAAKRIVPAHEGLRRGDWSVRYGEDQSLGLAGKTLLLVGYGAIGRALAGMGRAFGMRVIAIRRRPLEAPELDAVGGEADLPRFLAEAEALICSLPGTGSSAGRLGEPEFAALKPGALFVNVGRGTAVCEDAFFAALASGRIGAAGIDTWWRYPESPAERVSTEPSRHPLAEFDNLVFSPHRASHVAGRETARIDALLEILRSLAAGEPQSVVDRTHWY